MPNALSHPTLDTCLTTQLRTYAVDPNEVSKQRDRVEVVEGVEEPVLERELARIPGLRRDMRVDGGLRVGRDPAGRELEVAAGIERVTGKVQVVLVTGFGGRWRVGRF